MSTGPGQLHEGLKAAIAAVLPGASWQRCRTHFIRNLLTRVPKSAQPFVATMVRTIFAQPDADTTWAQLRRVLDDLAPRFPAAARLLEDAQHELLAFSAFGRDHWRQLWSTNPQERLNRELRRRSDVVGIFPDRSAIVRLVGAVLAEQHDEWQVTHRYMGLEYLAKMTSTEEVVPVLAAASSSAISEESAVVLIHHAPGRGPRQRSVRTPSNRNIRPRSWRTISDCRVIQHRVERPEKTSLAVG